MNLQESINKLLGPSQSLMDRVIIAEGSSIIVLIYMSFKPELRSKGLGTKVMKHIIEYSNTTKKPVKLRAGGLPDTVHSKLIPWYESFGFEMDSKDTDISKLESYQEVPMTYNP